MKRVFLTLPSLDGHRQIYCRQFCDYFLSRDFAVTVATELAGLGEFEALRILVEDPRVTFIPDTWSGEQRPAQRLRGLVAAARAARSDVTFLAEADTCAGMLAAQLTHPLLRLPGRRVALFIRSTRYVHQSRPSARLRFFYELVVQSLPVLEKALALDEVFVARRGGRYVWLPDIAEWSGESGGHGDEAAAWQARISDFLAAHQGSPVVVYIGMPQERRNYEHLLQLACDIDGVFLHCGALQDPTGYPHEEPAAHRELVSRSAILESGRFYQSFETARVTLAAGRCVALPYGAEHLTSSGAMLQALMAGRPVLVPDRGLMAHRVREFGLGLTFVPDDRQDMRTRFLELDGKPPGAFEGRIQRFLDYFSRPQFEAAMDAAFFGSSSVGPRLPAPL